jgi:hypothetical protein
MSYSTKIENNVMSFFSRNYDFCLLLEIKTLQLMLTRNLENIQENMRIQFLFSLLYNEKSKCLNYKNNEYFFRRLR